jgi:hypothetical protein
MQLAFRFRENYPSIIQIREIACPQIDWLRSKRYFRNDWLTHSFEPQTQSFVDNLFQTHICFPTNVLEKGCDIVIETQGRSHKSQHTPDAALPEERPLHKPVNRETSDADRYCRLEPRPA